MMGLMTILRALLAAAPLFLRILGLFIKTPPDKLAELSQNLLSLTEETHDAVKFGEKTGDYSRLEDVFNSRF